MLHIAQDFTSHAISYQLPKEQKIVDSTQWVKRVQKRNFGSWISLGFLVLVNSLGFEYSYEPISRNLLGFQSL